MFPTQVDDDATTGVVNFQNAYRAVLLETMHYGVVELNERTGVRIKALPGGASFKLDLSSGTVPEPGNRRTFPGVAAAELAWQVLGTRDATFIMQHAPKVWGKFLDVGAGDKADVPVDPPTVQNAYGWRWRNHFGRDQLGLAIKALHKDSSNRQIWVSAWDPTADGLGGPWARNLPCPVGFSLNVVDDFLHCSVVMRSSDLFVGLPYDVMGYALLVDAVAATLGVKRGTLHFTLAHAHVYEPHWDMIPKGDRYGQALLSAPKQGVPYPLWSIELIEREPNEYAKGVKAQSAARPQHPYSPLPELVV